MATPNQPTENIRTLADIELLTEAPLDVTERLAGECAWSEYAAGDIVVDQNESSTDVYFIVSGKVRVVNYSLNGKEVSFDDIDGGGFFGELAAIDGKPRSASVVAMSRTLVASMTPKTFLEMLEKHFDLSLAIMRRLTQIVRGTTDRIMDLSTLRANGRIYAHLLRLAREHENEEEGSAEIPLLPTHTELANRAGTARETVARAISELREDGIAEKRGRGLYFPDITMLETLLEAAEE